MINSAKLLGKLLFRRMEEDKVYDFESYSCGFCNKTRFTNGHELNAVIIWWQAKGMDHTVYHCTGHACTSCVARRTYSLYVSAEEFNKLSLQSIPPPAWDKRKIRWTKIACVYYDDE